LWTMKRRNLWIRPQSIPIQTILLKPKHQSNIFI
jgi:hypothetical protein